MSLIPDPESCMSAIEHWTVVTLVWVGFGALAGLLATAVFPLRQPFGPFATVVVGIVGSTIGLLGLHWLLPHRAPNPLTPAGISGRHDRRIGDLDALPRRLRRFRPAKKGPGKMSRRMLATGQASRGVMGSDRD